MARGVIFCLILTAAFTFCTHQNWLNNNDKDTQKRDTYFPVYLNAQKPTEGAASFE